jgi:type I restriction-modification system DNA methylase subunit
MLPAMPKRDIEDFISHWKGATAPEQSISQQFLCELCDLLEVPQPGNQRNGSYTFEFHVSETQHDGTTKEGRIDLYKRASFILESKKFQEKIVEQTSLELAAEKMGAVAKRKKIAAPVRDTDRWDDAMLKAFIQARDYVRALPTSEPAPPFLLVVDVGHVIEVRADFSLTGRAYQPFPDPLTYRIQLDQLRDEKIRKQLKQIWTDPQTLDPSKRSAEVTREVAKHLAELAKSFEKEKHTPKIVAEFLTRCLFCMFAEDVGLLPNSDGKPGFSALINSLPTNGEGFETMLRTLFAEMNEGRKNEISVILRRKLLKFNGGLFADNTVLPVNGTQLGILKAAAALDWQHVEPAIFGTLLERALGGEGERHKLGAHFTPRSYVERLVLPTVIEPLRAEWENVRAAAVQIGKSGKIEKAREEINRFHQRLCEVKVLDPACGSGNFLYVALEHLKRLEGEVLDFGKEFGEGFKLQMETVSVDPHQFLGLEINPRAASIAEMVLWIGYLQWHFRTRGQTMPAEPVLKNFKNIQCRDAVLAYDGEPQPALDAAGNAKSVWNRLGKKTDTVTGREVPDETKRVPLLTYTNPRPATWPEADFIVGNPPFIGTALMRDDLGDGYAETLRAAYPEVPESANFVMYWWHKAAQLVSAQKVKRFGLITTNAISQTFNRRVVQSHLSGKYPFSLAFVIPDHPWVDTADGAAVRIAMTVGVPGEHAGELLEIKTETEQADGSAKVTFSEQKGKISAYLTLGANVSAIAALKSNDGLACPGVKLHGSGFIVTPDEAKGLGLGKIHGLEKHVRPYRNGKDLTDEPRGVLVIDLFGLAEKEVREKFPAVYQHVLTTVKPERDANNRATYRDNWWIFGEPRRDFRPALAGLRRYIATTETSKHRFFQFLDTKILPDNMVIAIALDDFFQLGVLSSRIHVVYSLAAGGVLEDRPRYNKSRCFDPFPFPLCGENEKARIRELAEALDAHRKQVQAKHGVTLTGLYNVLEKIRAGETLTEKEKFVHDRGLVSTLKSLHDDLDTAVFAACGWPASLTDAEILERLVALNAERAAEEARGVIHWLRPEYQTKGQQGLTLPFTLPATLGKPQKKAKAAKSKGKAAWPKTLPERMHAIETALHAAAAPIAPADLAAQFARAKPADVTEILKTLETFGRARKSGEGKFTT